VRYALAAMADHDMRRDLVISHPPVRHLKVRQAAERYLAAFAVVAAAIVGAAEVRADDSAPTRDSPAALANPLASHSLDEFAATRDRPLFTRGRRPPAAPAPAVTDSRPEPPAPPNLVLFGTLVDDEGASAIVRGSPSDKPALVRVGDQIHGWTINRIEDRRIVLSLEDQSATFTMFNSSQAVHTAAMGHPPPVLEVNSAGVLRAHRASKHIQ
jgi:hypothetical protein